MKVTFELDVGDDGNDGLTYQRLQYQENMACILMELATKLRMKRKHGETNVTTWDDAERLFYEVLNGYEMPDVYSL